MELEKINFIWTDKKRILGMPISFTRYSVTDDRLFIKTGFLTTTQDEILLYRIRDLTYRQTVISQRGCQKGLKKC